MKSGPDRSEVYQRWTRVFVVLIAAACVIGIVVPAGLGWDFANFYDAGRRVAAGQIADLYHPLSLINGQPPQGRTGFFGAPVSAIFYLPLVPFTPETALILFKIENVLASAATFGILLAFYTRFAPDDRVAQSRFAATFAFLFLIYQPFWTVFRVGGQTTATVLLLLVVGLVAHTKGRFWGSALCVVLAALIKPALAPAVLLLACVSGFAFFWRITALMGASGVLSILLLGWPVHASFLDLMNRSSGMTYAWHFNSSIYILIDSLRLHAGTEAGLTYAAKATVVATILWLMWRNHREPRSVAARRHVDFLLAIVFFLLWSPTIWEHYLSLLFPLLIYIVAAKAHFRRSALAIVTLIFALSIGQNLIVINWLRYGFPFDTVPALVGITLFKSGPLLLTILLLWWHGGDLLRSHTAQAWGTSTPPRA